MTTQLAAPVPVCIVRSSLPRSVGSASHQYSAGSTSARWALSIGLGARGLGPRIAARRLRGRGAVALVGGRLGRGRLLGGARTGGGALGLGLGRGGAQLDEGVLGRVVPGVGLVPLELVALPDLARVADREARPAGVLLHLARARLEVR